MRKPLSPLQAFAEDTRLAAQRSAVVDDALVTWLSVAQSADQLSALKGKRRDDAIARARSLLANFAGVRPTMKHDARPAPEAGIEQVAEQFRAAAEAMEQAGYFELAFTTVAAICRLTSSGEYVSSALATVHLGRIARQMNDLSTAEDCYTSMLQVTMRERDGPLAARAHIGLALLHDMRGNLPAAEKGYLKALALAVPFQSTYVSACQGLMSIAIGKGDLADALLYGWRLYDATEEDFDARTSALSDLAVVAMNAGFHDAALRGFEHALTRATVPRIRLDALAGAMRAAARIGDARKLSRFDIDARKNIARANLSHGAAFALLCAAEAWARIGNRSTARDRLTACLDLSTRFNFHEYRMRADALAERWEREGADVSTAEAVEVEVPLRGSRLDPAVDVSISRLEALSV